MINLDILAPGRMKLLSRKENNSLQMDNNSLNGRIESFVYDGNEFVVKIAKLILMLADQYDLYEINEDLLDILTGSERKDL